MGDSLDPQNGEEVEALAEEEQAEDIAKLPTPHPPTLSGYLDYSVTHYPTGLGVRIASKDAVMSSGMNAIGREQVRPLSSHLTMRSSETRGR